MKTNQHTPGPWEISIPGYMNCHVVHGEQSSNGETNDIAYCQGVNKHANAHLIAAAPELLEACRLTLEEVIGKEYVAACVDDIISPELRRLWKIRQIVKSALAKAEGTE